jgi:alpha-D-ribose 1-methylphosphonate 5-phosphate C-P lyase
MEYKCSALPPVLAVLSLDHTMSNPHFFLRAKFPKALNNCYLMDKYLNNLMDNSGNEGILCIQWHNAYEDKADEF